MFQYLTTWATSKIYPNKTHTLYQVQSLDILAKVTHVSGLCVEEFVALVYAGVLSRRALRKGQGGRRRTSEDAVKTPSGMFSALSGQHFCGTDQ